MLPRSSNRGTATSRSKSSRRFCFRARGASGLSTTRRPTAPTSRTVPTSSSCAASTVRRARLSLSAPTSTFRTYSRWTRTTNSRRTSEDSCSIVNSFGMCELIMVLSKFYHSQPEEKSAMESLADVMAACTQAGQTPREHFVKTVHDELAKFERKEIEFQKMERHQRAARLRLPIDYPPRSTFPRTSSSALFRHPTD